MAWAVENGIVFGYSNGSFGPDNNITRQDMAVILMRFSQLMDYPLPKLRDNQGFGDAADIAVYAKEAVEALFRSEIITGKGSGLFEPKGLATRAEAAVMLNKFLETINQA